LLSYLSTLPYALWVRGDVGIVELLAATVAMLLFFYAGQIVAYLARSMARPVFGYASGSLRLLACVLFVPLLSIQAPELERGDFQLTVLDVGQGSAAVIQTQNHVMVFDAGARFSDRLNAGSGVVIPYLRSRGTSELHRLVISHGDADHIGGAQAILDEYPETSLVGQDIESLRAARKQLCTVGFNWHWDGVDFVFLSPANKKFPSTGKGKRNNQSCVFQVRSGSGSILLTGDIEKDVEQQLVEGYGDRLDSDILVVPHHGSKTSSSNAFLQAVNAKMALISVGYKNRYRLPNKRVLARYEAQDRGILRTDKHGAITIRLVANEDILAEKYRENAGKYWHHIVR
jgi:competence protein ComEC